MISELTITYKGKPATVQVFDDGYQKIIGSNKKVLKTLRVDDPDNRSRPHAPRENSKRTDSGCGNHVQSSKGPKI